MLTPCNYFQLGKCNKGSSCNFAHIIDPSFKRKACQYFTKGNCNRGDNCKFSHAPDDINHLKIANGVSSTDDIAQQTSEARLKEFRWKIPRNIVGASPLGHRLSNFFKQGLELVDVEVGTMQEVITLLTSDGGLLRIEELLEQPFESFSPTQLYLVLNTQLMPFFKIFTNVKVTSSILMRAKVMTVYNIMYTGDGTGRRIVLLFTALAIYLSKTGVLNAATKDGEVAAETLEAIQTTLAVLSKVIEVNTPARTHPEFILIAELFAKLLKSLPKSTAYAMGKAKKDLEKIQQCLGVGQAVPSALVLQRPAGARATFKLARAMPGVLSEEGVRHDNDHIDIRKVSILPTLQEIQSSRNEYLPSTDPKEWHFSGMLGLVDRNFRLLREDTVGQLRDAAKFELERLQNPHGETDRNKAKRQGARTNVYDDVYIRSVAFDEYQGAQLAICFAQPHAIPQQSKAARKEWWDYSKRLAPDALICLISSEGSAVFFVVAPQGQKPTQLQAEYNLASDPEHAYVVVKPVNQTDLFGVLSRTFSTAGYEQLSVVEFPGVLLPSFEPTLRAMQCISTSLDLPFWEILVPLSTPDNPDRQMDVQPPSYANEPGFKYDLSSITIDNGALNFAPRDSITDAAAQLAQMSTLDPGQAIAVISSLARCFAAIQGPPGTGKSFTGVQLIRIALSNKKKTRIGPIIVCTQTNHALDAVLERSVDDGVSDIVRVGGRSKSERLQDVNLNTLSQRLDLTKTEKSQRWEATRKVTKEVAQINALLEAFDSLGSELAVKDHLLKNHPSYHLEIFGETDDEGFTFVRRQDSTILDTWLKGGHTSARRQQTVLELSNKKLCRMTHVERRLVFDSWLSEMKDELRNRLDHALSSYNQSKEELDVIRVELQLRVLRCANIIGITTSGLARNLDLLRAVNPKVLICEEAGEVLEAHMLTALLPSIEHCILIGDHQQLRPQVQNFDLSIESRNGGQYALDVSLFERLVQPRTRFTQPLPFSTLETQRRMHPSISRLIRNTQYSRLEDDPGLSLYPEVVGMRHRLFWMHHDKPEENSFSGPSNSRSNLHEVDIIAALVKHLAQQGTYKPSDIAVITPYRGQLRKLRNKFNSTHTILLNDRDIEELEKDDPDIEEATPKSTAAESHTTAKGNLNQTLRLATVDNFQGEEAKVIIVSLVRSNKMNDPGFLRTPNRINVLLSRAQHGLYIIGNSKTTASVPMWHHIIEMLRRDGNVGEALELCCPRHKDTLLLVNRPIDFARLSPEAGCNRPCEKQLGCGHACTAKCHSDMLHGAVYCMKPCTKLRKGCEHLCPKPCGDKCDRLCRVPVDNVKVTLACGHKKTNVLCYEYQDPSTVTCKELVERTVPGCSHEIVTECHVDTDNKMFRCSATCGDILDCGHACQKSCHMCKTRENDKISKTDNGKCERKCDRPHNMCKHRCQATCHQDEPCPPCTAPCDTICSHAYCGKLCFEACSPCLEEQCSSGTHCPHTDACPMPCAAPCTSLPCSERCEKNLSCGCRCPSVCGEECPDVKFCQKHGSDDVRNMHADLLTFTPYKDVDLDADPCIFTPCGHVFTIDSLDGTVGMADHYEINPRTGKYTGLRTSAEPFSVTDSKPCPECRGSLRKLARYGRIVRRALLDESTKKLTVWSNRKHLELAIRLSDIEGELMDSLEFPRKPTQVIELNGSVTTQIDNVKKMKTSKRYRKIFALINDIAFFAQKLSNDEQPYQRVHDLVEMVRRQNISSASIAGLGFSSEEVQPREHLQARNLLVRSHLILLSDVITVHNKTPTGMRGTLRVDLGANRTLCEELIAEAVESKNIRQEAEANVLWAKLVAMECGVMEAEYRAERPELQHHMALLKSSATDLLEAVRSTCAQQAAFNRAHRNVAGRDRHESDGEGSADPMQRLADEAANILRMLEKGMSSSEMRMVVSAMAKEFGGTGHWYRCVNGHPFTVGECGMPMEMAMCPECGAGVGGQHHRATEGVTQARDIEERFGRMEL
ncbi:hypothetical protein LTR62_001957 [Meristemomyces frigidus]|uniref:NF-X1 finger and helicase domain protein n=1 Tax=Meristemomyces frigidus TaxID=1508187 RepID=A0AAN7T8W8_9PEZI|nr:hypothetical protein LTR62_001957 [Meristemomyces frigidus]